MCRSTILCFYPSGRDHGDLSVCVCGFPHTSFYVPLLCSPYINGVFSRMATLFPNLKELNINMARDYLSNKE